MRFVIVVALLFGCGRVEADHPLDPDTPPEKQHKARLSGQLVGPPADADHTEWEVNLFSGDSDAVSALFTQRVDAEGNFLFEAVPPGLYRFSASVPGYAADDRILRLGSLDDFHIGRVLLRPVGDAADEPGGVTGKVSLRRFLTVARLTAAKVELSDGRAARSPVADGTVSFADVAVGDYVVTVRAPGYDPVSRPVRVTSGADVDFGTIELPHASTGGDAQPISGTVALSDGGAPGGTRIEVRIADTELVLASVVADVDGVFLAAAAPEEGYTLHVSRAGYQAVSAGPYVFDEGNGRFEDGAGEPPALALDPE